MGTIRRVMQLITLVSVILIGPNARALGPTNISCETPESHALPLGSALTISGSTIGSGAESAPWCSGELSPVLVYALSMTTTGTFRAVITTPTGSHLLPVMEIRRDCSGGYDSCNSYGSHRVDIAEDLTQLAHDNLGQTVVAGIYYVLVSGSDGTSGAFTLRASLSAATCGDGVINAGEECDPSTLYLVDGCGAPGSATPCKTISPGNPGGGPEGSNACPGEDITIQAGMTIFTEAQGYSTWGYQDNTVGSCLSAGWGHPGGPERVLQFTPAMSGTMEVDIGYAEDGVTPSCEDNLWALDCWAPMLYARSDCATPSTELDCQTGQNGVYGPQSISFPVVQNVPVWVFVDGWDGSDFSSGPFNLVVSLFN